MLGTGYPEFYWLNVTNVLLGAATVGFVVLTIRAVIEELWSRHKAR